MFDNIHLFPMQKDMLINLSNHDYNAKNVLPFPMDKIRLSNDYAAKKKFFLARVFCTNTHARDKITNKIPPFSKSP